MPGALGETTTVSMPDQTMDYQIPEGVYVVPDDQLDLRPDAQIDHDILNPQPVQDEKNVWFFWHSGFANMHPYTKRNVRAYHRRFSRRGWRVRVIDNVPGSPLNIANYVDVTDPANFPAAFRDHAMGGAYALQHTSDLVRFPLLLKYGGVYTDAGMMQIGDLDRLWEETVANPDSPFELISYNMGSTEDFALTNYFFCAGRNNPLFQRCHRLFLELWAADGGKNSTEGMYSSPLLKGIPLLEGPSFTENGRTYSKEEGTQILTDYIIQGQAVVMAMGIVDEEDNWDGPKYCREHIYAIDIMTGSQLINGMTAWDGTRAWELMSLRIPAPNETDETADQKLAREIVENCLSRSFGFKLATGLILRMLGPTLSSMWRENEGSDDVPGTYAHWLRFGIAHWCQKAIPPNVPFTRTEPYKRGPLLRAV